MIDLNSQIEGKTLAIIKPDSFWRSQEIRKEIEYQGFSTNFEIKMTLTLQEAKEFYQEHQGSPFFEDLTSFMSSGPISLLVLELPEDPDNVVYEFRRVLGSTDPELAAEGTLRALFGTSKSRNAVHGSDSVESAEREIQLLSTWIKAR